MARLLGSAMMTNDDSHDRHIAERLYSRQVILRETGLATPSGLPVASERVERAEQSCAAQRMQEPDRVKIERLGLEQRRTASLWGRFLSSELPSDYSARSLGLQKVSSPRGGLFEDAEIYWSALSVSGVRHH